MNRSLVKYIALFTMTLDHIGVILLQSETMPYLILRSLGRIAFVLFAFMIAEGFHKSRDVNKYFLRLFIYASGIEFFILIYYLISNENYLFTVNVIWPLVFGLGALILLKNKNIWIRLLAIPIVFLAELLKIPYGAYGVMFIVVFGLYRNVFSQFLMAIGLNLIFITDPMLSWLGLSEYAKYPDLQWFSMLAFIFIFLYNGKKGPKEYKWLFYIYYPAHIVVLYAISYIIG